MDKNRLDNLVNAKTIESIRIDVVENGFSVCVILRSQQTLGWVFAQPRQVTDFVQERLSKLPD